MTAAMVRAYPTIRPNLSTVLVAAAVFLVATEATPRARLGGIASFLASGVLAGLGFVDQGSQRRLAQQRQYDKQQQMIRQEEAFIDRYRADAVRLDANALVEADAASGEQ